MIRMRSLLAALVVTALLGACTDDDPEPDIEDPTSSAPTRASTGSAPPTSAPTQGATPQAVVEDWVRARNGALETGDTAAVRALTDPGCPSCMSLITSIEEVYGAGGSYDTKGWTVKSAKVRDAASSRPVIDAAVVVAGGTTIDHAGAEPVSYGSENHIMVFKIHDAGNSWLVDFVGFVS